MCIAIEFNKYEIPLREHHKFRIDGELARVSIVDSSPLLAVKGFGGNRVVSWGNSKLFHCRKESLVAGKWRYLKPESVEIIANRAQTHGIWFQVKEGIRGVLINTPLGEECYILTEPATHYFKTMTGSDRMPVLVGQII